MHTIVSYRIVSYLLSVADNVRPLWRHGVSCHVRAGNAEDAHGVCSDGWSCRGVCSWARDGQLWQGSVAAFREVFGSITVFGCWFNGHHSQAVLKRVKKIGLKEDYQDITRCILVCHYCLPAISWLICKRFVRPPAMTCRSLGSYSSWWRTFNVNGYTVNATTFTDSSDTSDRFKV